MLAELLTAGLALASPGCDAAARADTVVSGSTLGALELRINVPARRLDVIEAGRVAWSAPVAVGVLAHPTPLGSFRVTRAVWNPWWFPPPFDWAAGERATPPGPDNPTGRVKLQFGRYLFVHGTPDEASVGRVASHGCVRMRNEDAIRLARLVHRHASPDVPDAVLDRLEAEPSRTATLELARWVPLAIVYDRVEVRGDTLEVHPDPYGLDPDLSTADVTGAILAAGRRLDPDRVEALLREAGEETARAGLARPSRFEGSVHGGPHTEDR